MLVNWQNRKIFEGGAFIISPFLLDQIHIKNDGGITVKSYQCAYTTVKNQSFLSSFTETGSDGSILNPLTFQYGSNTYAPDVSVSPTYSGFNGNNTYTGDVTGDGRQDVIAARYYYDNNNVPHYTAYDVIDNLSSYGGQPALSLAYTYTIPQTGATQVQGSSNGYYNFLTYDYDGDTKQDVLMISNSISGNTRLFNGVKINYSRSFGWWSSYQTVDYTQIPSDYYYTNYRYIYSQGTYYIPGDFDGDGAQDYILILGLSTSNYFKAFFSSPAKNIINQEIISFGVGGNPNDPFYATTVASTPSVMPVDFDGDGKMEILVQKAGGSYILSVNPLAPSTGYSYGASVIYTFNNVVNGYRVFPGDFNGDGKTDLLVRTSSNNANYPWNILYSTGTIYKSYPFYFQNKPYLDGDNGGSAHHLVLADFNNDGKTDIWHSLDQSSSTSKHTLFISNGVPLDYNNSTSAFSYYNYYSNNSINRNQSVQSVIGDFNFDGKPDIFSINGTSAKIIYVKPNKEENLMVSATNGLGAQAQFSYTQGYNRSYTYDDDNPSTPLGQGPNGNPYSVLKTPMYVAEYLMEPNGSGSYNYTGMQYEDAMYHPFRGFLGFKKVTSTNYTTGVSSVTYSELNTDFYTPVVYKITTDYWGTALTEAQITSNLVRVNPGNYYDKRYVSQISNSKSFNYINGSGTETTNTYDSYGNITNMTGTQGTFSGTTISPVETISTSTNYVNANTPVPSVPSDINVTKTRAGQSSVNKSTAYTYNGTGLLASQIDFSGAALATTSTYYYDVWGHPSYVTVSAPNTSTPYSAYEYDIFGRYLQYKQTAGSGTSKVETFTYNTLNDQIASATTTDGLTTSFTYDGFGRVTQTGLPDGNTIVNSIDWEQTDGRYSTSSYRQSDLGKWSKKYFDLINRPVKQESHGFNNELVVSTTEYDYQGRIYKQVQPHYSYETATEVTNAYDYLGRITSVSNGNTTTNYSYSSASGGLFTTTTTNGANQSASKTTDASGKVVSSNDNGGQLDFTYDSWGNQLEVKFGSTSLVVNTYDNFGRQKSLTDKNAGTIMYEYDDFGQIVKQTDANNNIYEFVYDDFGRLIEKDGPAGGTSYTYYSNSITGKSNDNISSVIAGNTKTYQYDNLQRLISETTTVSGQTFTKSLGYDGVGNLINTTYPSGITINDTYDINGILTQTSMTYGGSTQTLFTATAMNSRGVYTSYNYGNGKSSTVDYDFINGTPTRCYTQGIQDLNLSFDNDTHNLLSRQDAIKNLTETFTYDDLNRLTGASVNNVQQFSMTYDGSTNNSLGNIQTKSDIGNYRYDAQKINALRFLTTNTSNPTAPPFVITQNTQTLTYTPFLKTATINDISTAYQLTYTYGEDEQRIKSVLSQYGSTVETKYYLGPYEMQTKNGITREIQYVHAGNGLCAIIVKEGGQVTPYFVYTDQLGSLLTLTDVNGNVVAEQNFDAWGRNRNPNDWTYNNILATPDWLYRGFTGHEHVKEFALINMNGRMYDPVTCRMLSPDNNVPLPWNTQGYNRYGYANNNPLKYIDPDGNFWHLIIGALIGGTLNLVSGLLQGKVHNLWDGLKYFGTGAVSGALGAGVGAGVSSSLAGGSFGAGFVGNAAASTVTSSFINGAIVGAAGGFAGGFAGGLGNGLIEGQKFGNALGSGLKTGAIGGVTGGIMGGIAGGIDAVKDGRRFFDGAEVKTEVLANQNIPLVGQVGDNNCIPASVESMDKSFGGTMTQNSFRSSFAPGTDPNSFPLMDVDSYSAYSRLTGHTITGMGPGPGYPSFGDVASNMQAGARTAVSTTTGQSVGHAVVIKSITAKTITSISGSQTAKIIYTIMDPGNGGHFYNLIGSGSTAIPRAFGNIFFIR